MIYNIYSFTLVGKDRRWFLACENETEKREWTRMFMRLRDTKAPIKDSNNKSQKSVLDESPHRKSLNLGPHFKTVTQVKWCPTIPGILATGSEDESVKIWQTHLLDHTLIPAEYDNDEIDKMLKANDNDENMENDEDKKQKESVISTGTSISENKQRSTYPLHAIEFQPIAEYKTSGQVTCLEWSPDGSMLVASLRKEMGNIRQSQSTQQQQDNQTQGQKKQRVKYGYFIQCFDLHPILGQYTTDWDDFGGDNNRYDFDDNNNATSNGDSQSNGNAMDEDDSRTKIFTLQDHPSRLVFSNDGTKIYMAMDIDPNSEENEKRRPAFLVYLDLTQNQLHRCKTVDRMIDHQTEFIVGLAMNNARSVMVVAASTHQGTGRMIAWDIDKNETRIVERKGMRISSLLFTDDDSWLIVGRNSGKLEFWNVYNENNKKLQSYYKRQQSNDNNNASINNPTDSTNNNNNNNIDDNDDDNLESNNKETISLFELKYAENIHSGPVFHVTTSNGILISSAKPNNLEYESFFIDNIIWDIRQLMNIGRRGRMVSRLHNVNDQEKDITRLLDLSPVTPRHVREGGGPGTLLAASGDHAVYCHNMMDVLLDSLSMGNLNMQ